LSAALGCFTHYGFNKTSLDDIAETIGIKKTTLYYYYKNKETIFYEVIKSESARCLEIVKKKLAKETTARRKLILLIKTKLEFFREKHKTLDLSVQAMLEVQPIIKKLFQEFRQRDINFLTTIIQEGIGKGEFRKIDAGRTAECIHMMTDGLKYREMESADVHHGTDIDYEKIEKDAEFFLNLLINGLEHKGNFSKKKSGKK
jgi:AcrR family transcriptional regulator